MRDNTWLTFKLFYVWKNYFPELERKNKVIVQFKGKWKNKFGHIKELKDKSTEICVNGLFKLEQIPEYVIDLTLAHELIHYMHGFHSPYPKLFKYPHQGNVVNTELKKRGFSQQLKDEKNFIKNEWSKKYQEIKKLI